MPYTIIHIYISLMHLGKLLRFSGMLFLLFFVFGNTVRSQDLLRLNIQTVSLTCADDGTGAIILSGSGGVPPYQFSINVQPFGEQFVFRNLQAGTYRVRIRDSRGSEVADNATISSPLALVYSFVSAQAPSGCNLRNGAISVRASGGTSPYTFTINGREPNDNGIFSDLPGGTYLVRVTDRHFCFKDTTLNLFDPALDIAIQPRLISEPLCTGENTGSFEVEVNGGQPPYEYSLDGVTYQEENKFTGLAGGYVYTVFVKGANGCFNTASQIIREPLPMVVKLNVKHPLCDIPDGRIGFNVSGGTPPYRYSIDNGVTFKTDTAFTQLTYGPYNVVVRDANNCGFVQRVDLRKSLKFETKVTVKQPSCALAKNGSIRVEILNGAGAFEYSIDGLTFKTSNVFDSLLAGRYIIYMQNDAGCGDTVMVTLRYVNDLTFTTDIRYPDCTGGGGDAGNGVITVHGSGGRKPYRYSIDGVNFQSDSVFRNITAVPIFIYVLDANNCFNERFIPIYPQANDMQLDIQVSHPKCFNSNDGEINVRVLNGRAPFAYNLNGQGWQPTGVFRVLGAGNYFLAVRDGNDCASFHNIELFTPQPLEILAKITPVSCTGRNDGGFTLKTQGGNPPYRFTIVQPAISTTDSVFQNLDAGDYELIVTDANGCEARMDVAVHAPEIVVDVKQPTCAGNDGEVKIEVRYTEGPILYEFQGDTSSFKTVYDNLRGGMYLVRARLANGCIIAKNVVLESQAGIDVLTEGVPVSSCGAKDGQIIVNAKGGVAPVVFSMDNINFQYSNIFYDLAQGNYTVYIRDASNCLITKDVTVPGSVDSLRLTWIVSNVSCPGGKNGSVLLTVVNGERPLSVLWSTGATTADVNNLPAGTHTLTVTDARGCRTVGSITVKGPEPYTVNVEVTDTKQGENTGVIVANVTGATAPYTYQLNGGTFTDNKRFENLDQGIYTLRVRDASGCDTVLTVEVKTLSGIAEESLSGAISLYPNPASDVFYINLPAGQGGILIVTDLTGKIVYQTQTPAHGGTITVPTADQAEGLYIVKTGGKTGKVVIRR